MASRISDIIQKVKHNEILSFEHRDDMVLDLAISMRRVNATLHDQSLLNHSTSAVMFASLESVGLLDEASSYEKMLGLDPSERHAIMMEGLGHFIKSKINSFKEYLEKRKHATLKKTYRLEEMVGESKKLHASVKASLANTKGHSGNGTSTKGFEYRFAVDGQPVSNFPQVWENYAKEVPQLLQTIADGIQSDMSVLKNVIGKLDITSDEKFEQTASDLKQLQGSVFSKAIGFKNKKLLGNITIRAANNAAAFSRAKGIEAFTMLEELGNDDGVFKQETSVNEHTYHLTPSELETILNETDQLLKVLSQYKAQDIYRLEEDIFNLFLPLYMAEVEESGEERFENGLNKYHLKVGYLQRMVSPTYTSNYVFTLLLTDAITACHQVLQFVRRAITDMDT